MRSQSREDVGDEMPCRQRDGRPPRQFVKQS